MAQHNISITVINNSVGVAQSSDGIMMIFAQAVAVDPTFALDTAYLLTQLSDATDLGIDADYDTTNGTALYQQINDFTHRPAAVCIIVDCWCGY